MPPIDRALLDAARQGDRTAFAQIVRGQFRVAFSTALSIVQNPTDAEDVVQDAFVRCWQRLGQCENSAAFGGWFRTIVRSVAHNHLERERVRATESIDSVRTAAAGSPAVDLERAELRTRLSDAMRGLTDVQREVLLLFDLEGFRHAEIAELIGVSEGMSRRHLLNARQRMRTALGEPEPLKTKEKE